MYFGVSKRKVVKIKKDEFGWYSSVFPVANPSYGKMCAMNSPMGFQLIDLKPLGNDYQLTKIAHLPLIPA